MNCRHGRGTVCRSHCGSQSIFNREDRAVGHIFFIQYQVKGTTTLFVLNKVIVHLFNY